MVDFTNDLMGEFLIVQKGVFNNPKRIFLMIPKGGVFKKSCLDH
jgi:hypothetical protein